MTRIQRDQLFQGGTRRRASLFRQYPAVLKSEMTIDTDDIWDAGDMGCGDLVLRLRMKLRAMPGKTLKVIATDPGAPADLPSFCRMTGDTLLHVDSQSHTYWIKARG